MSKTRKLRQIFNKDGRTIIVAMDHGTYSEDIPGLIDPIKAINDIKEGGADAVLVNPGFAEKFANELAELGLIIRLDLPPTRLGEGHESTLAFDVEDALRLGADAVAVNGNPGKGVERISLPSVVKVVKDARKWQLPVMGEIIPGGFDADPGINTSENIALSLRIGSELGVDFIKTRYSEDYDKVMKNSFVPVVVLGGAKKDDTRGFLESIKDAVDSGASGVAIGRNIWGADDTIAITKALKGIIKENKSVDEVVNYLK